MAYDNCYYQPAYSPSNALIAIGNLSLGAVQLPSSTPNSVWFKPKFELSLQKRDTLQIYISAILAKQFKNFADYLLDEVYQYSKIFAAAFDKTIDDRIQIPQLIQELKEDGHVTEEDWNRLTTLLMVLDGLDVEINEYGGKITIEDAEYVMEYIKILKRIMSENNIYVGVSAYSSTDFFSDIYQTRSTDADTFINFQLVL